MSRRKKPNADNPATNSGRVQSPRHHVALALLTFGVIAALVWGVSSLGDGARRGMGQRDRYSLPFASIECDAPASSDRATFLSEVRYVSNFPEYYQSVDPDLIPKLRAAFCAHPMVAAFEGARIEPNGTVLVKLRFRLPILSVKVQDRNRVVDADCVLLPLASRGTGLPELVTPVPAPTNSAGQVWRDETVNRAVELVGIYHPQKLERVANGWRLTLADNKTVMVEH